MATPLRAGVLAAPFIGLVLLFVAGWTGFAPSLVESAKAAQAWTANTAGWAFILVGLAVVILVGVGMIRLGHVRIGGETSRSGHSAFAAVAIGLAASTSLGLLFWSTAEPLYHIHQPPQSLGLVPKTDEAQIFARVAAFVHWGVIVAAMNALALIVFGLTAQTLARRSTLDGAITRSERPRTAPGLLDGFLIFFATFVAVGAFASCILALSEDAAPGGRASPGTAALFAMALAMIFVIFVAGARPVRVVYATMAKGALILMIAMMVVTVLVGPGFSILSGTLRGLWHMVISLPSLLTFTGTSTGDPWPTTWSATHWGNAMIVAPLIGLFLSRAARGFRLGQAVVLFTLVPAAITILWIAVIGGLAISMDETTRGAVWAAIQRGGADDATYAALYGLPGGASLVVGFVILIALSFATFAAALLHGVMRVCAPGTEDDPDVADARSSVAIAWCAGVGLAGWGLASFNTGPVADTLAQLGALPALAITLGLLVGLLRLCINPRSLTTPAAVTPVQIDLDLGDMTDAIEDDLDDIDDMRPVRRKRRKSA